ncbi:DUF2520 domain-containing protein [Tianweitania sediminis]|uniref:DUF2520 domain-containing protein n=2 Tax=Tianweitania sediminis TaxID=1502156 RepID=A0A8J7R0X8_9HYPH|nr:Rossmann-like and DUF2520 domain-containing protein [Tianweitania sediminis]MBP0440000.1 DUF2520 domain-containing protein [Tianweitania sediminis]
MAPRLTVNLVGPGKVGQTLGRCIADAALHDIQDVCGHDPGRTAAATAFIGSGTAVPSLAAMRPADIWLITVPDTRIGTISAELRDVQQQGAAVAVHCSGFLPASEMLPLRDLGWSLVSAHPVLTFADPALAAAQFPGTQCGLEGDSAGLKVVADLMQGLGAHTFPVSTEGKPLYHAAAVISSNFAVVLQALAREAWQQAGVPDDVAKALNRSMLEAVVENVTALGPQGALTGPASRGDWTVVTRQHVAVSEWHPQAGEVYQALSFMARRLKRSGSTLRPVDEES